MRLSHLRARLEKLQAKHGDLDTHLPIGEDDEGRKSVSMIYGFDHDGKIEGEDGCVPTHILIM